MAVSSPDLKAFLVATPFFGGLADTSLDRLVSMLVERRFDAGAVVVEQEVVVHRVEDVEHHALEPGQVEARVPAHELGGVKKEIGFGSQIRSYVMHPYQLVKDHRTKEQVNDVTRVLDGDIDLFIKSYLMKKSSGTLGQAADDDIAD